MKIFLLLVSWLAVTVAGFWVFEGKYLFPVTVKRELHPVQKLAPVRQGILAGTEGKLAVVLNFWNPGCGCSRFMEGHVKDLVAKFSPKNVEFISVVVGTGKASDL